MSAMSERSPISKTHRGLPQSSREAIRRLLDEGDLRPLSDIRNRWPAKKAIGRRPDVATLLRWIRKGIGDGDGGRIKLEGVRIGSQWFTTDAACVRFITETTRAGGQE